ncbi:MAG: hypothetical protein ABIJ26_02900 [Candidatus Margulisiibacteriota bacterium]
MKLDIEVKHFNVFNLLLLLIVWTNTCYVLFLFLRFFPGLVLVSTLLFIAGGVLSVATVILTLYLTAKWIRHHNLGWWVIVGMVVLFILSYALESTVKSIFYRQQVFDQQELR